MAMTQTKPLAQMELVEGILKLLGKRQVPIRVINACITAANNIISELERPSVLATAGMGLRAWLASDDTGSSSKWMAYILAGGPRPLDEGAYPHDPDDFGRCYRFLRAVPEARGHLENLAACGPVWFTYVAHWDEMERLYEKELPTGNAPLLYEFMRKIREEA